MSRKSKSKSGNKTGFIVLAVILVMLILAIVGVCINWISRTTYLNDNSDTVFSKLGDLFERYKDSTDSEDAGAFRLMAAFGILTVILAAATAVLAGITKVLGWKLFKFLLIIVSVVCVISGVVSIITSFTYCDTLVNVSGGIDGWFEAGSKAAPAAGAWLTAIGGALAGLGGVFVAIKS